MSADALVAEATRTIGRGSKSFAAAARLFDPRTRAGAVLLYAWCRHCDDVIDGQDLGSERLAPSADAVSCLAALERETRAALAGRPADHPAFAGLAEVMRRHAIPAALALHHLDGFRMDVEGRRYATVADTLDYAYRVAGVVGVMMARVMGVRDEAILDRACDLGIAFQLTNIARDLVADAQAGRVYAPAAWLDEAGIPPGQLARPEHRARLAAVASRLLDEAEPYYASARIGIAALPPRSAWAIATALGIYRQIGLDIRALGASAWDRRVSTSMASKLGHVARGARAMFASARKPAEGEGRGGLYPRPAAASREAVV